METNYVYKNLEKAEEKVAFDYLAAKIGRIEDLLQKFSHDSQVLKILIEKFDKHNAYNIEFCLTLPTKSLISSEASHQISKAADLSLDRLLAQIKKHLSHLRKDRAHQSIRDNDAIVELSTKKEPSY